MIDYHNHWMWDYAWLALVSLIVLGIFTLGLVVGRHQGYWKGVAYTEKQWLAQPTSP